MQGGIREVMEHNVCTRGHNEIRGKTGVGVQGWCKGHEGSAREHNWVQGDVRGTRGCKGAQEE